MNALSIDRQHTIAHLLAEGTSIRAIERLTGTHRDKVMRLLVRVGGYCRDFLDLRQRNLTLHHFQLDEIWTFVRKKQGRIRVADSDRAIGDQFLFLAVDEDTTLIACYAIGKRTAATCHAFLDDLASRVVKGWTEHDTTRVSTDGSRAYPAAVNMAFNRRVKHGVLIKEYRNREQPGRYGPPEMIGATRIPISNIDPDEICTSHVA